MYNLLRPARTLSELGDTLLKFPLKKKEEFDAFYSHKYGDARGIDRISYLQIELNRCFGKGPFHGFVMGHPGVGKSTEISRLLLNVEERFRVVRINAAQELFPGEFRVHDLLWLIVVRILSDTNIPSVVGFSDRLSPDLLADVRQQLSQRWVETLGLSASDVEGGLDFKLFAKIRATLKLSRQSTEKTVEYNYSALSDLLNVVNRVFEECNDALRIEKKQEWILVVEDFEKLGVEVDSLRRLFIHHCLLFEQLQCHLLFVIPVGLAHTEYAERMPFGRERQFMVSDIAVYTQKEHQPDEKGINGLLEVVDRRIDAALLNESLARSLAIASGGNIRDLFDLLTRAGLAAEVRGSTKIEHQDALEAVQSVRYHYRFRLGESGYDESDSISLQTKIDKLEAIYRGEPAAQFPDKILYVLLRQRIVLQFGAKGWFGVHPLVVDLLKEQDGGFIKPSDPGGTDLHGD